MATRALASSDGQNGASAPKPAPVGRKTSAAKLAASLDWQPPASPATTMRPQSVALDLGRAIERGLGGSLGATPAFEQELWEVRSEIEKAKLRHVAPFPFFGKAMRFQDEFAALQITDDGRFSYSFVDLNYEVDLEGADQQSPEDPKVSRVLTYEGVLISPVEEIPQEEAEPEAEGSARIEGLAMAKHEIEDVGGRAQLMSISRSSSRFAIVVSPYFQPNVAVVYSLHLARSPRRPRRTQLAYVGRGMKRELHSTTRNGDVWRLTQQRRRAPKPKFSKSGSTSMLPAAAPSKRTKEADGCSSSKLTGVASAPQLPALVDKKDKKAKEMTSITDWRDFYKQRAQELLGS